MLKSVVLCVLLWHGVCEFSSRAQPRLTNTTTLNLSTSVSRKINGTDVQIEPKVNYNFNDTIFYANGSSTESTLSSGQIRPVQGYIVTNGIGAHKLHTRKLTWSEARQICIDEGGDLAVIRSDAEEAIVKKMVKEFIYVYQVWIGFHDLAVKGYYISVFNETLLESGWAHWVPWIREGVLNRCVSFL